MQRLDRAVFIEVKIDNQLGLGRLDLQGAFMPPWCSVYHLYGPLRQCSQILREMFIHALSILDAVCNEIIGWLSF